MASPVGIAIRNEKAQLRINDALALFGELLEVELPENPARSRDPLLREMLRMEWTAETLEVLANASIGRIEPMHDVGPEDQSEPEPEQNNSDSEQNNSDSEQNDADSEQNDADSGQDDPEADQPIEDSAERESMEPLDPVELKKLKLDALKEMASERGIADVEDVRSKDEVIEKLIEGTE